MFEIKIKHTKESYIGIGVVDISKQFEQRHSSYSGNAICFWGVNGRIRYGPGDKKIEIGYSFGSNDVVTTIVNLEKGKIEWKVNGMKMGELQS